MHSLTRFTRAGRRRRGRPTGALLALAGLAAATITVVVQQAPASADASVTDCSVITNCLVLQPRSAFPTNSRYQVLDFAGGWDAALASPWGAPIFYGSDAGLGGVDPNQEWSFIPEQNTASWSPSAGTSSPPPGSFQIVNVANPSYCLKENNGYTSDEGCSGTDAHMAWYLEPISGGTSTPDAAYYLIRNASDNNCLNQQGGSNAFVGYGGQSHSMGYSCNPGDYASQFLIAHAKLGTYSPYPWVDLASDFETTLRNLAGVADLGLCAVSADCHYNQGVTTTSVEPGQCVGQIYQNNTRANETVSLQYQYSSQYSQTTQTSYTYGSSVSFQIGSPSPTSGPVTWSLSVAFSFSYTTALSVTQTASNVWSSAQTLILPPGDYAWFQTAPIDQTISGSYTFKRGAWNSWTWNPPAPVTATSFGAVVSAVTSSTPPNGQCLSAQTSYHPV